jgi:hypothetical protein
MSRIKRGGYIFWTSVADHSPRHVHVFRDDRLVLKWDLERGQPMQGFGHRRIVRLITELQREGKL